MAFCGGIPMQPIPDDILKQFNAVLEQKAVSSSLRDDYRKWLRYYLDFRIKYPPPDAKSEQARLFIEKMRSKGKSGESLHHAAYALSPLFYKRYPVDLLQGCVASQDLGERGLAEGGHAFRDSGFSEL